MPGRRILAPLAGGLLAVGCSGQSLPSPAGGPDGQVPPALAAHHAELDRGSLAAATLRLSSGVTTVHVRSADLPSAQLLAVSTPPTSSQRPNVALSPGGVADVQLDSAGTSGGPSAVTVLLARPVTWTVVLDGGATGVDVDLRGGHVRLVDLAAGVTHATVDLPASSGTQVFREEGGASELTLGVPRSVACKVHVAGGAANVQVGATTHTGVGGDTTFTDPGYGSAADRLDVELDGGVSSVTIQKR